MEWILTNLLLPTLCSFVATYIFWNCSSKLVSTRIRFAPKIERSVNPDDPSTHRLRIKLINVGWGDVYDVNYMVRLSYRQKNEYRPYRSVRLDLGQRSFAPAIYGRKMQRKRRKHVCTWTLRFHRTDEFYTDFARANHKAEIRERAEAKLLTFDDVIEEYKDSIKITVFAFGVDSLTGVERFFRSKDYFYEDIVEGHYNTSRIWKTKYSEYLEYVLSIEKHTPKQREVEVYDSVGGGEEEE